MKKQNLFLLALLLLVLNSCNQSQNNFIAQKWNNDWHFFKVDTTTTINEEAIVVRGEFPNSESITLPHTANIEPEVVNNQWQGICYYKKTFLLAAKASKKRQFIRFDGAMNVADVWVNGTHMVNHLGGYLPFEVEISDVAKYGEENLIVVKLNNMDNPITGPKPLKILDFNMYGGLYRNAWFVEKDNIYITDAVAANKTASGGLFVTCNNITKTSAVVNVSAHIVNRNMTAENIDINYTISTLSGTAIVSESRSTMIGANLDSTISFSTTINNPLLWSPDAPNLYKVDVNIYQNGKNIDLASTRFGIRDIVIRDNNMYLNGEKIFLRGVNRHQDYPYIGYALSDNAQYRDAKKIKDAGFNYIRSSHYPQSPAFLAACDELGIFVLDAILGWQYFNNTPEFIECAVQGAKDLIRRDRNHPCVFAWELSINETWMPKEFIEKMIEIRDQEDPSRPTAGWVKDGYDIYLEARQHRHGVDPSKPLIVSEYGDWEYYAQNAGLNQDSWADLKQEERTSRQPRESGEKRLLQQAMNIQEAHNDNLTNTHCLGDGYWVMYDYNRGYADDLEYSGIMDIFRLPKYSYFFYKSQRDDSDELFIASNWEPGVSDYVRIYSNSDEVELYVDGDLFEKRTPDNNKNTTSLQHPPFTFNVACLQAGVIEAVGYKNGKEIKRTKVGTAGDAKNIKIEIDECGKPAEAGVNDALFVYAYVVDENDNIVHNYYGDIEFTTAGDATLINPIAPVRGGIACTLMIVGEKDNNPAITARFK